MESFLGGISRNLYPDPSSANSNLMKTRTKGPPDEPTPEEAANITRGRAKPKNASRNTSDKVHQSSNNVQANTGGDPSETESMVTNADNPDEPQISLGPHAPGGHDQNPSSPSSGLNATEPTAHPNNNGTREGAPQGVRASNSASFYASMQPQDPSLTGISDIATALVNQPTRSDAPFNWGRLISSNQLHNDPPRLGRAQSSGTSLSTVGFDHQPPQGRADSVTTYMHAGTMSDSGSSVSRGDTLVSFTSLRENLQLLSKNQPWRSIPQSHNVRTLINQFLSLLRGYSSLKTIQNHRVYGRYQKGLQRVMDASIDFNQAIEDSLRDMGDSEEADLLKSSLTQDTDILKS